MIEITKGGWNLREVKQGDRTAFIGSTDEYQVRSENDVECIATMGTGWATGKAKANAQLIVSAPKLYVELVEADETICQLCKRLNPQHENCTSCEEREYRLKAIAEAEGK